MKTRMNLPGPAVTVDEIMEGSGAEILEALRESLFADGALIRLKDEWFLRELLLEVGEAYLNLSEAVLDVHDGGAPADDGDS